MLALQRMKQAQIVTASQQGPEAAGGYTQFGSRFNAQQDSRAYAYDLMDPDAQRKLVASLGKPGSAPYQRFLSSLKTAHDAGVLGTPPQQAQ